MKKAFQPKGIKIVNISEPEPMQNKTSHDTIKHLDDKHIIYSTIPYSSLVKDQH